MVRVILFSYITVVLFQCYSCWIINDINTKMLAKAIMSKAADDVKDSGFLKKISFIFPGTKWCGAGNIADNYEDLGTEIETDMCCRDHDNCPEVIPGGETKHNLTNDVFYSRLSCHCDNTFHRCLKFADTRTANIIGHIYFNALQTKCYRKDHPVLGCTERGGWLKTKCRTHSYDTDAEQVYQWFDEIDY